MGKKCYPQIFLENYKSVVKENKMIKFTNKELEMFSDEPDEEVSDERS